MDYETAKGLKLALETVMQSLDAPMKLVADVDDPKLRRMIGTLASKVTATTDYEILPYLYALHPELKSSTSGG